MKKLLIVNQNSGYLTVDVANAFKQQYDEVVVMYGKNRITERDFARDIKIQSTITYNRTSNLKRILTWALCTCHLFLLLLYKYRGYTILYYTNPPMSYINSLFFKNKFGIVVYDVYPDALTLIGIKPSNFIYKFWAALNKKVFKKAEKIVTLSEGMKNKLLNYVEPSKVNVVSVWPASDAFKPVSKQNNEFLKKQGWSNHFIVLYSGNMGIGHPLELLVDVAEILILNTDILFLFVGEGAKKNKLMDACEKKKLSNVKFLTWQDKTTLPHSLASADIAVVALEPEATHASVPSKTFNYMSVGAPILAIGNSGSELENLIKRFEMGMYAAIHDTSKIVNFILNLKANKQQAELYAQNAFKASKQFTYQQAEAYLF
ncbi:MAG: glycosyltransferase family 4 protein [Bacteroidia bacterium]